MNTQVEVHPSLVLEGDATSSLSRRNFIGASAVAVGALLAGKKLTWEESHGQGIT